MPHAAGVATTFATLPPRPATAALRNYRSCLDGLAKVPNRPEANVRGERLNVANRRIVFSNGSIRSRHRRARRAAFVPPRDAGPADDGPLGASLTFGAIASPPNLERARAALTEERGPARSHYDARLQVEPNLKSPPRCRVFFAFLSVDKLEVVCLHRRRRLSGIVHQPGRDEFQIRGTKRVERWNWLVGDDGEQHLHRSYRACVRY